MRFKTGVSFKNYESLRTTRSPEKSSLGLEYGWWFSRHIISYHIISYHIIPPAFYGTRRFLTALTSARHLSLSWASQIQSTYPHPTSWRSILVLSSHLRLGLHSGLFLSGFPTSTLYIYHISYHIISYHISYHIISYIILYLILYLIAYHRTMSYHIIVPYHISYRIISHHIITSYIISHLIISYPRFRDNATGWPILSCNLNC